MPSSRYGGAVAIPDFLTRKAITNRAREAQDIAQQREDRLSSRDAWEQAVKERQLTERASAAEDRAASLKDQNEAMNLLRQQHADVEQKLSELKDASTAAQLQKQNYDLDRQVRAERDAAAYLKQVSTLDPTSATYRKDVTGALASYPLALESKPAADHFTQAAEDSRKYADQAFHLANIGKEEQAKIDAQKGVATVKTINAPIMVTGPDGVPVPKLDANGQPIMQTTTSKETVVPNAPPPTISIGAPEAPSAPVVPQVPAIQVPGVTLGGTSPLIPPAAVVPATPAPISADDYIKNTLK